MPFLYIILGIISFFTALFLIPVRVVGHYEDTFDMYLKYFFIKIPLYPREEKEKEKKKKKKTKKKDTSKKPEKSAKKEKEKKDNIFLKFYKNQGFDATLQLIKDTLDATTGLFGGVFKHLVFKELFLEMIVSGPDAAETAIKYGKICSAVFPAFGLICSKAKVRKYDVNISPDFLAVKDEAMFHFKISISPVFVTNSVIAAAFKLLKNVFLKLIKAENADNKDKKNFENQVKKSIKER